MSILLAGKDFSELTPRWTPMKHHDVQWHLWNDKKRFKVAVAGRRSGKTELAKRRAARAFFEMGAHGPKNIFLAAPVTRQAKRIYWDDMKKMIPSWAKKKTYDSELIIISHSDAQLHVFGMDVPARVEGVPWDLGILDEYANMNADAWPLHVRPSLSTLGRPGECWFIGVPEGRNHFFRLAELINTGDLPAHEWGLYSWPSSDILDPEELESAKQGYDPLVYAQEYDGKFISFEGLIYYNFDSAKHFAKVEYNPDLPLVLCFDFNISPGVAVICQEQLLPNELKGTAVIDEVYIKKNSNTKKVCEEIGRRYASMHRHEIWCYGDPSGGSGGSSKLQGSDWEIVKRELRMMFNNDLYMRNTNTKPTERARVNSLNTRLLNGLDEIHLMINPDKCKHTVIDFENVKATKDGSGAIDKRSDMFLTHLCFAGDTLVDTDKGVKRIDEIPSDGKVRTWNGEYAPYVEAGLTMKDKDTLILTLSDTTMIKCTPDHKLLTDRGWLCAKDALNSSLMNWRLELSTIPAKSFRDYGIFDTMEKKGILEDLPIKASDIFIDVFGWQVMERYQKDFIFIMRMVIEQIINSITLNASQLVSIGPDIQHQREESKKQEYLMMRQGQKQVNGMGAKKELNGINDIMKNINISFMQKLMQCVFNVIQDIKQQRNEKASFVATNARQLIGEIQGLIMRYENVLLVEKNSRSINTSNSSLARNHVATVKEVKHWQKEDVYCLRVPEHGCFCLANGMIVSNSDGISYYTEREFPVRGGQLWDVRDA